MQVNEFKAWLEGFKAGINEPICNNITKAQWDKINKKIDELETSTGWHTAVERPVTISADATSTKDALPSWKMYAYIQHYGLGLGEHNQ